MDRVISRTMIKPTPPLSESIRNQYLHATPWGLNLSSTHYIQWGFLFSDVPDAGHAVGRLRTSLSAALHHFHPLAGRLRVEKHDGGGMSFFIDSNAGEGVEFTHAVADDGMTAAEVARQEVPNYVLDLFPLNGAVSCEGHSLPLFAARATKLAGGGIFLASAFNHIVGDGTSYVAFLTAWAELCRKLVIGGDDVHDRRRDQLARPPVFDWLIDGVNPPIKLPSSHPDELVGRYSPPPELQERVFPLSSQSIAKLKSKANQECKVADGEISAFQALSSLLWRSIIRVRGLNSDQITHCNVAADNRPRLSPPLPSEYFGCAAVYLSVTARVGNLLGEGLGQGAMRVHEGVVARTNEAIREAMKAPAVYGTNLFDPCSISIDCSPRFDLYGCDFGWGRPAAIRSGPASKYDGKVALFMGKEGRGSVDLEINLAPESMAALESNEEFMSLVAP